MKSKIILTLILFSVSLFPISLIYLYKIGPGDRAKLEKEVFAPYFTALNQGSYELAWEHFTTENFKKRFSLQEYKTHYQKIFHEYGLITQRNLYSARRGYNPFTKTSSFTVDYQLKFEKGFIALNYGLIRQKEGNYKIDTAAAISLVYSRRGYPW